MSHSLPQYRYSAYFEMVQADLLVHCPGFQEMVLHAGWAVEMWGGQSAHNPSPQMHAGKSGIDKAVWDKWPVRRSLLFVCCRWSCWRDFHCTVLSWLSSWTCWLSPSPPQPCWAATGALGPRKYPSLCVGRAKPPSAWVSPCHPMQMRAMFHLRTQCTTAGRLEMTALPSDTSIQGCGFPVKRAWKGQVVCCSGSHNLLPCIYSREVWNWKVGGWEQLETLLPFPRWYQPCALVWSIYFCPSLECSQSREMEKGCLWHALWSGNRGCKVQVMVLIAVTYDGTVHPDGNFHDPPFPFPISPFLYTAYFVLFRVNLYMSSQKFRYSDFMQMLIFSYHCEDYIS